MLRKDVKFVNMNNNDKKISNNKPVEKENISRRDALRKIGYAAFASSTMLLLLNNPTKVHAQSLSVSNPGGPGGGWPDGNGGSEDNFDTWDDDWD